MFYLSNRKLRYIIITLLLLIFCFFLGMFKPKADGVLQPTGVGANTCTNVNFVQGGYAQCNHNSNYYDNLFMQLYTNYNFGNYVNLSFIIGYQGNDPQSVGVYVNDTACQLFTYNNNDYNNGSYYFIANCSNFKGNGNSLYVRLVYSDNGFQNFRVNNPIHYSDSGSVIDISTLINQNNQINNNISNINDSINDSSVDTSGASSSASNWNGKNATNGTITQLLTLPITLLQAIVNGISTSCNSFSLGSLFGTNITLPCINLSSLIGSGLFTTIDILFSGFMILAISKKLIKIFNDFTNLKSNQIDELYGGGN